LQRGGSPTAKDRVTASVMGYLAIDNLLKGKKNRVMVVKNGDYTDMDIDEALDYNRPYNKTMYNIIKTLAI
jgi:6-phosphofructokinase 1